MGAIAETSEISPEVRRLRLFERVCWARGVGGWNGAGWMEMVVYSLQVNYFLFGGIRLGGRGG